MRKKNFELVHMPCLKFLGSCYFVVFSVVLVCWLVFILCALKIIMSGVGKMHQHVRALAAFPELWVLWLALTSVCVPVDVISSFGVCRYQAHTWNTEHMQGKHHTHKIKLIFFKVQEITV